MRRAAVPTADDFRARHRGGGLFTETINQRIGSYLCVFAYQRRPAPTLLTPSNPVIGVGPSIAVVALAAPVRQHEVPSGGLGLGALVPWQLAYSLGCAD